MLRPGGNEIGVGWARLAAGYCVYVVVVTSIIVVVL